MDDSTNSIQKACRILSAFSFEKSSYNLIELCNKTGFAKTTVHRICSILVAEGFLNKSLNEFKYSLSPKVFELGSIAIQNTDIKSVAGDRMFAIANKLGETVSLFIENNFERVCINTVEGPSDVRMIVPIGEPFPLYLGATGRVLLAWMETGRRDCYLDSLRRDPPAEMKMNLDLFFREIDDARQNLYAISYGERVHDTISVASPIFYGNNQVAALAVSGPAYRFDDKKLQESRTAIMEAAQIINRQLR